MRKILLINPTSPDPPPIYYGPPYGLAIIAAVLENKGYLPFCIDFERETIEEMVNQIKEIIKEKEIQYVGISCQSSNRGYVYKLIKEIKNINRDIIIILGGPFATQKNELLLRNFLIDYIVMGDGEITFYKLIKGLEKKKDIKTIKGLSFKDNEKIIYTEKRKRVSDLDKLPFPAFHLFDVDKRLKKHSDFLMSELGKRKLKDIKGKRCMSIPNALMVLSSIGCIYSCSFCPMSGIKESKYREHSPKRFVDMVEHLMKKYEQKYFVFGDNFFTKDNQRTKTICQEIIDRNLNIEWICMTRTDYVNKELLEKMKKAGCLEISFGVETLSEKVQERIGKNLNLKSVKNAFELCETIGIRSILMLMVGNEGETKGTIYETLSKIKDLRPDEVQVKTTKVYPGTKIHQLVEEKGIISDEYYLENEPLPPVFTYENSELEIKKLRDMFKLRDINIKVTNLCNNNCKYCKEDKKNTEKNTEKLKETLLKLAKNAHTITFSGGEPLLRKDLIELIEYANKIGIDRVQIETNARILSYNSIARKLAKLDIINFIVPFMTINRELHDRLTNVDGSFIQTCKGIKNLISTGKKVTSKINIYQENYEELDKIIKFLLKLGIEEFIINYGANESIMLPHLDKIKPFLKAALKQIEISRKKVSVNGVPYCTIPEYEDYIDEIHRPFDEIYSLDNKLINIGKERRRKRRKIDKCKDCKFETICEGFLDKKIFDLDHGIYITSNILNGYDCYEEKGICENNCTFCCDKKFEGLKEKDIEKNIKINKSNNSKIILCCGEPTNINKVNDKIKLLKSKYNLISLATNGRRLKNYKFALSIVESGVDEFYISLHGHNENIHDKITGSPGSFKDAIEGIKNIIKIKKERGKVNIATNMVLLNKNVNDIYEYIDLMNELRIEHIKIDILIPLGINKEDFKENMPSYSKICKEIEVLKEKIDKNNNLKKTTIIIANLPYCTLKGKEIKQILSHKSGEFEELLDEKQTSICKYCKLTDYCEGVFKDYIEIYGNKEFINSKKD